jgi:hypothetical protein
MIYTEDALDGNNYPTDEFLEWVKSYNTIKEPANELLQEVLLAFQSAGRAWVDNDVYSFATLGWSGNEEMIMALRENHLFWGMHWQSSERGGLHKFKLGDGQ